VAFSIKSPATPTVRPISANSGLQRGKRKRPNDNQELQRQTGHTSGSSTPPPERFSYPFQFHVPVRHTNAAGCHSVFIHSYKYISMRFVFGLRTTISAELDSTIATLKMTRCGTHMKLTLIAGRHILNLRHRDKVATNSQKQRHWKKKTIAPRGAEPFQIKIPQTDLSK